MPATKENATFRGAAITHFGEPWTELPAKIQYIAFGLETCPQTNRLHYQTWAYANKAMRLTGWKKIFPGDHIEQMRGSFAQNDKYCSKESDLTTFGEKPMDNGKKRTLQTLCDAVLEAAENGTMLCDVVTEPEYASTFVQYNNGVTKLHQHAVTRKLRKIDKDFAPEVIYVSGPPGCGKSRYVYDKDPDVYKIPASDKYKWKDGYCGQDAVLYDNMSSTNINPFELLQEIDRYYMQVPVKGGFIGWRPHRIYITAVDGVDAVAAAAGFTDPREFTRRITEVVVLNAPPVTGI